MENDSIRPSGSNTLVDIWIDGKLRAICVTREAIDAFLGLDRASRMSDADRCEFVRSQLPLVLTGAKAKLGDSEPGTDSIIIDGGELPGPDGLMGNRRKDDRRKAERRKGARATGELPHPDRRRSERRKQERRRTPARKDT